MDIVARWGITWIFLAVIDLLLFLKRYDVDFKSMLAQLHFKNLKMYFEFFVLAPFIFFYLLKTSFQK